MKEPGISEQTLVNRAKASNQFMMFTPNFIYVTQGMLIMGAIFKQSTPDETDQERRELER